MSTFTATQVLFNNGLHYVALTDMPGVQIGLVGGEPATHFNIPAGHAWYDRVRETSTAAEAAGYYAEMCEAYN